MAVTAANVQVFPNTRIPDYTPSMGTGAYLVVFAQIEDVSGNEPITACTFGATAMEQIAYGYGTSSGHKNETYIFLLKDPGSTQQQIAITGGEVERMSLTIFTAEGAKSVAGYEGVQTGDSSLIGTTLRGRGNSTMFSGASWGHTEAWLVKPANMLADTTVAGTVRNGVGYTSIVGPIQELHQWRAITGTGRLGVAAVVLSESEQPSNFTYTLPTLRETHSDFQLKLRTEDFPTAALDGSAGSIPNGGGPLRAYAGRGRITKLPLEVVSLISGGSPFAEVWALISSATSGQEIYLEVDPDESSQPLPSDTYGKNAVWPGGPCFHGNTVSDSAGLLPDLDLNGNSIVDGKFSLAGADFINGSDVGPDLRVVNNTEYWYSFYIDCASFAATSPTIISKGSDFGFRKYNSDSRAWTGLGSTYNTTLGIGDLIEGTGRTRVDVMYNRAGWTHLIYINGAYAGAGSSTGISYVSNTAGHFFNIGPNNVLATMDHIRFEQLRKTANRIADEYDNESVVASWGTIGTWEAAAGGPTGISIEASPVISINSFPTAEVIVPPVIELTPVTSTSVFGITEVITNPVIVLSALVSTNQFDIIDVKTERAVELSPVDSVNTFPDMSVELAQEILMIPVTTINRFGIVRIEGGDVVYELSVVSKGLIVNVLITSPIK